MMNDKECREYLEAFKDGCADGLFIGTTSDNQPSGYKQGYDYGIYLWCELNPDEEVSDEWIYIVLQTDYSSACTIVNHGVMWNGTLRK